jgi:hypothetical protein
MNWVILFLIAFVTTAIVFTVCGAGGGFMMLLALNGFSESNATPILIFFALIVFSIGVALSTTASWVFIKSRHAEATFRFWNIAGISVGVNILAIIVIFAVIATLRLSQ